MVLTKTRYFLVFNFPRTSVMPYAASKSVPAGVQFHWTTSETRALEGLHNSLVQALREGLDLSDLRGIADIGAKLQSLGPGVPFIPEDAPLPTALKAISSYVKRVI